MANETEPSRFIAFRGWVVNAADLCDVQPIRKRLSLHIFKKLQKIRIYYFLDMHFHFYFYLFRGKKRVHEGEHELH